MVEVGILPLVVDGPRQMYRHVGKIVFVTKIFERNRGILFFRIKTYQILFILSRRKKSGLEKPQLRVKQSPS